MTLLKFRPSSREMLRDSMFPSQVMNMFDSVFNDSLGKFERNVFFTPRVDIVENEQAFTIEVSLPGLKKDEINIDINGEMLTINGERKMKTEQKESKYHTVESYYGKFSRSFTLPENVDKTNIHAEYTEGILKLEIPKVEAKQNKTTISIK